MEEKKKLLAKIKSLDWSRASVSLYLIKRTLVHRQATYDVLQVNADDKLRKRLRGIASSKIQQSNNALEYDFHTADLDDNLLGIATSETDFQDIIDVIAAEDEPGFADSIEQLIDSWLYIARLDIAGKPPMYAARRVSEGWTTKKVSQLISMIFQDNMLVDIEQKEIFRIDGKVDFFSYDGTTFIADKKNFETALNFREGMERNRDEIVDEFHSLNLFENAAEISALVGDNIRRLRRLSQVKKAAYYKDANFLANLKRVNAEEGWGIKYSAHGKLLVTEEDIEIVLRVLNNDRLTSKINSENFDVDVKHKLGSPT
ncbi:MAG: DUF4868 domain-containing protein [Gallionella sp.]|nr:DUF4868 domain-containing protein [Gallionella sp.]